MTVLRSPFSVRLENGMPPGQPRFGASCQAGHLEGHDPFGAAEQGRRVAHLIEAHQLQADPVVVVVVLRATGPGGRRDGPVEARQGAREGPFRGTGVVGVEVAVQPLQARVQFRRQVHAQVGDEGHADGGRERLRKGPQKGEGFAHVQRRAPYVVSLLHRPEAHQRPGRVAVEDRLGRLLRCARGRVRPRRRACAGDRQGPRGARGVWRACHAARPPRVRVCGQRMWLAWPSPRARATRPGPPRGDARGGWVSSRSPNSRREHSIWSLPVPAGRSLPPSGPSAPLGSGS